MPNKFLTMTSDAMAVDVKASPVDILGKKGCKVQSFTVSDQHATLLVSYPEAVDSPSEKDVKENDEIDQHAEIVKTTSSLLKLTLVPFHKALLGSNPVISPKDIERGQMPERNLLEHDPKASEEIISFLRKYNFELKSDSGAEYSYYTASPQKSDMSTYVGIDKSAAEEEYGAMDKESDASAAAVIIGSSISAAASKFGSFDVELISPASAYQLSRAMPSLGHVLIRETPEMYDTIVKPYIQSIVENGSLSWISNVVEVKKEKERLLVNHDNFIINIDTKWRSHPPPLTTSREEWFNHPSSADLYCLGIVKQYDITCLRDLRQGHISLLKEMEEEGLRTIKTVYGVDENQIRVYIHYQPQFYHLHLHFTRLENETGCAVERGHLVRDVIQNLEMDPEYYCKRVITYKLKKGTPLHHLIEHNSIDNQPSKRTKVDG